MGPWKQVLFQRTNVKTEMVFLCLFGLHALAFSQDAARPTVKVGDKWVIETLDNWKQRVTSSREVRVSEVTDSTLKFEIKDSGSGKTTSLIGNLDGNTIESSGRRYDTPRMDYSFPLFVGKKWNSKDSVPSYAGYGVLTVERTCEVLALENVVTRAGTFNAYKIRCEGPYTNTDGRHGGCCYKFESTRWYSPEAKYFVKHEYKNFNPRGVWDNFDDQLVSFELVK